MKKGDTMKSNDGYSIQGMKDARFALDIEFTIRTCIAASERARRLVQATEAAAARPVRIYHGGVL